MDENSLISLAIESASDLKGVCKDVAQIKELLSKQATEVPLSDGMEVSPHDEEALEAEPVATVVEVQPSVDVPSEYFPDMLSFQWMQTVLLVFVLVAMFLNFGATLWLAFSDKWRS